MDDSFFKTRDGGIGVSGLRYPPVHRLFPTFAVNFLQPHTKHGVLSQSRFSSMASVPVTQHLVGVGVDFSACY